MRVPKSKVGVLVVAIYLLLTSAAVWQTINDYDSYFLLSFLLTSPVSLILLVISHLLSPLNAIVIRIDGPYLPLTVILGVGALFNATMLYLYVSVVLRKE
jgi:hypothetical protein